MKKSSDSTVVRVLDYYSSRADWFESLLRYFMLFLPSDLPNGYQNSLKFSWFEWIDSKCRTTLILMIHVYSSYFDHNQMNYHLSEGSSSKPTYHMHRCRRFFFQGGGQT